MFACNLGDDKIPPLFEGFGFVMRNTDSKIAEKIFAQNTILWQQYLEET